MNDPDHRLPSPVRPDDSGLESLIQLADTPVVTEMDVTRLCRRVRRAVGGQRTRGTGMWGRLGLASAAAMILLAVGTVVLKEPSPRGEPTEQIDSVKLDYVNGTTIFEFADQRSSHRIVKSRQPHPGADGTVAITRGRFYVDRNGQIEPGTAVFYRIN